MDISYKNQLKKYTDTLLNINTNWPDKREMLIEIANLFTAMEAYDVNDFTNLNTRKGVTLNTGHALSTWSAAMCLLEISRTTTFLKGIIEAIQTILDSTRNRPIHILDAGCGPYALLSLLPALYFNHETVKFHLIDIIPENIASVKNIITSLEMDNYFGDIHLGDATSYQWPSSTALNMIISETMLNALRKEPQVAITRNLAPQLASDGIFIPQEITVDLVAVDESGKHRQRLNNVFDFCNADYEIKIDQLFQLKPDHTTYLPKTIDLKKLTLPTFYDPAIHSLEFYTNIKVFGNHTLQESDCSLTMPYIYSRPYKNPIPAGTTLNFSYEISSKPGIQVSFVD